MEQKKLESLKISLLALRLTVALVFLMWTLDKILVPGHAVAVFTNFYNLGISENVAVVLGYVQLIFVLMLAIGMFKPMVYLLALVFHAVSTLSAMTKYFDPFNNLLFFTAWPMLAACLALYLLRDFDTLCAVKSKKKS